MSVPQGVNSPKPNQECKLENGLRQASRRCHENGLRQASRKWHEKLTTLLTNQGYKQSISYHSLFTLRDDSYFNAFLMYMDDIILVGNSIDEIDRVKPTLDAEFKIKDFGKPEYFLGIKVDYLRLELPFSNGNTAWIYKGHMLTWFKTCENSF